MVETRSPEALLETLSMVKGQLKRASFQPDFVCVHARLNAVRRDALRVDQLQLIRAHYLFIHALAYAKPAHLGQAGFLQHSRVACLEYALEVLEGNVKEAAILAAHESGWSPQVEELQHDRAYEAAVIYAVLKSLGHPRHPEPDLRSLGADEQLKISKALAGSYGITSHF